MNTKKAIILSSMLACAVAQAAEVEVYITGATAFRKECHAALSAMIVSATGSPTGLPADNEFTFFGTVGAGYGGLTGKSIEVYCGFSGSVEGIRDVTTDQLVKFEKALDETPDTTFNHLADMTFSDVFQSSTAYLTPTLTESEVVGGTPGVGVIGFVWGKNAAAPASVNNVTDQQALSLLDDGVLPLSFWSDSAADHNTLVYVTGRNEFSGTRVTTLAETGYGIFNGVTQWHCTNNPAAGTWVFLGNDGHTSGSAVRSDLNETSTKPAVGYMGTGDAVGLTAPATQVISYNGNKLNYITSPAPGFDLAPIKEGRYTYWGYEHLLYEAPLDPTRLVNAFHPPFVAAINAALGATAVRIGDMNVVRYADGGQVFNSYLTPEP